jgi:hypothetical protein
MHPGLLYTTINSTINDAQESTRPASPSSFLGYTDLSMCCRCRLMVDGGGIEFVGGCNDGFRRRRVEQIGRSFRRRLLSSLSVVRC